MRTQTYHVRQQMRILKLLGALLLLTAFFFGAGISASAAGTAAVRIEVTYGQTEARSMLAMVNRLRTGSQAWYWNADNVTKTDLRGKLSRLRYDYDLEAIAMQRAAEIALSFAHVRPDGSSCFTATANGTRSWAENIAAGQKTAKAAFIAFREAKDGYAGQGHRRIMLGSGYTAVGVGHVYFNGVHYWVMEFGYTRSAAQKKKANNARTTVKVKVRRGSKAWAAAKAAGKKK